MMTRWVSSSETCMCVLDDKYTCMLITIFIENINSVSKKVRFISNNLCTPV